jgi:hypothetical protein
MADQGHVEEPKNFEPKTPVNLAPPKDDPITPEELSKCDGLSSPPPGSSQLLSHFHQRKKKHEAVKREFAKLTNIYSSRLRPYQTNLRSHQRHRLRRLGQRSLRAQRSISRSVRPSLRLIYLLLPPSYSATQPPPRRRVLKNKAHPQKPTTTFPATY